MSTPHRRPNPRSYPDLIVWQKAMDLAVEANRLAASLPAGERFVLSQQIMRSALSIPANIAEGHGRIARADYARFLTCARGSLHELETELQLARRLGHFRHDEDAAARSLADEVGRMLWGLIKSLRREVPAKEGP